MSHGVMCLQYYFSEHKFICPVNINKQGFLISEYMKD